MKLSEFIVLPQDEKRTAVLQEGVPVAQRSLESQMVFLFQLPEFFVETYCSKQSKIIEEYRAILKPQHLQPYLEKIVL
jgi:hypothetical protein